MLDLFPTLSSRMPYNIQAYLWKAETLTLLMLRALQIKGWLIKYNHKLWIIVDLLSPVFRISFVLIRIRFRNKYQHFFSIIKMICWVVNELNIYDPDPKHWLLPYHFTSRIRIRIIVSYGFGSVSKWCGSTV